MGEQLHLSDLEALYQRYGPAVYRRALALLGREADASDAVQDVFLKVLDSFPQFRGESSPMTWIYRVTTNLCLNRLRNEKRRGELHQQMLEELPPPRRGQRLELTPDIRALLQVLPSDVAAAGVYHYVDGMSHEEIARVLGVSRRTVGNWVARFLEMAQKRLS